MSQQGITSDKDFSLALFQIVSVLRSWIFGKGLIRAFLRVLSFLRSCCRRSSRLFAQRVEPELSSQSSRPLTSSSRVTSLQAPPPSPCGLASCQGSDLGGHSLLPPCFLCLMCKSSCRARCPLESINHILKHGAAERRHLESGEI